MSNDMTREYKAFLKVRPSTNNLAVLPTVERTEPADYMGYLKVFVILAMFILAALVGNAIISAVTMNAVSKNTQLQECVMRINPDPNTNYQLEVYKCMNGS